MDSLENMPCDHGACPSEGSLAAFFTSHRTSDSIELHLATCVHCRDALAFHADAFAPSLASHGCTGSAGWTRELAHLQAEREAFLPAGTAMGRYVIEKAAGRGGMGSVYRAHDPDLDRPVALKVLRASANERPEQATSRLLREARALARLAHPNVVSVFDVGVEGGRVFLAMEFVEGLTLRQWLEIPRTPRELLATFEQAGHGLVAAHQAGLVHRDFKPDNVLIGSDGRVRVGDFGLAFSVALSADTAGDALRSSHSTSRVGGTPAYMAPEQKARLFTDARADQYSFSLTVREAWTGLRDGAQVPYRSWSLEMPAALDAVLRRGASVRPEDRYPDMSTLLRAMRKALARPRALPWSFALVSSVVLLASAAAPANEPRVLRSEMLRPASGPTIEPTESTRPREPSLTPADNVRPSAMERAVRKPKTVRERRGARVAVPEPTLVDSAPVERPADPFERYD